MTHDFIGNKIAEKITSASKKKSAKASQNNERKEDVYISTPKKIHIYPEESKQIIDELRLNLKKINISRRNTANY